MTRVTDGTVLITGASGGIGAGLARALAREATTLILVARSQERLEKLAEELPCEVDVVPCDLSAPAARASLLESWAGRRIDVLVNNAGVGQWGAFQETDKAQLEAMLQLNVLAPVELTRHFLPQMVDRGRGAILNIGSTAGFQGIPFMAAYGGTKSFLHNFSEGLGWELRNTGVSVSALAPGSTRTNFFRAGGIPAESMLKMQQEVDQVVEEALRALHRGRGLRVSGLLNRVLVEAQRFVPRPLIGRVVYRLFRPPTNAG